MFYMIASIFRMVTFAIFKQNSKKIAPVGINPSGHIFFCNRAVSVLKSACIKGF